MDAPRKNGDRLTSPKHVSPAKIDRSRNSDALPSSPGAPFQPLYKRRSLGLCLLFVTAAPLLLWALLHFLAGNEQPVEVIHAPPRILEDTRPAPLFGRTCTFKTCPASPASPYLYIVLVNRNRGASVERLMRTLAADAASPSSPIHPGCICMTIADFDEVVVGAPITAALESWPYDYHVESLRVPFSKTVGQQLLLSRVLTTPSNRSIFYFIDADMVAYPGMLNYVLTGVRREAHVYAPVVWANSRVKSLQGKWSLGVGMIAFYYSDFEAVLNRTIPMLGKTSWGAEDDELAIAFHSYRLGFSVVRSCCPYLWHLYHSKSKWTDSLDGRNGTELAPWSPTSDWKLDDIPPAGPETLLATDQLQASYCRRASHGDLLL